MTQQQELDQIKSRIQEHLVNSGNYDIINKHLKLKLYESGWFDNVIRLTNEELQSKKDDGEDISFEELFAYIKPKAENLVPDEVKKDIHAKIQDYLDKIIE